MEICDKKLAGIACIRGENLATGLAVHLGDKFRPT